MRRKPQQQAEWIISHNSLFQTDDVFVLGKTVWIILRLLPIHAILSKFTEEADLSAQQPYKYSILVLTNIKSERAAAEN